MPMPVVASGVKPSQFDDAQHGNVAAVPDVQLHQSQDPGVVQQGDRGHVPEVISGADASDTSGGMLVDGHVQCQDNGGIEVHDGGVADGVVGQPPVGRSKRARRPNSKYDPAIYDLDSVEVRGIPLEGKKNGWKGIY